MSYRIEKTEGGQDIVWGGFETGIASSPHKGIANMQAVDINTELGEVMCSYSRSLQTQNQSTATGGSMLRVGTDTVTYTSGGFPKLGTWIAITNSTISGLSNGTYYVIAQFQLSATYSKSLSTVVTGMGAGTATWAPTSVMGAAVQSATERYVNTSGATKYRYYVLDSFGHVWVYDTDFVIIGAETVAWTLPYNGSLTTLNGSVTTTAGGLAVYNGWVFIFGGNCIFTVSTSQLGATPIKYPSSTAGSLWSAPATPNSHFAISTKSNFLYYVDGPFVGSIFGDITIDPDTVALGVLLPPYQSYCSYTSVTTTGTVTAVLSGSLPTTVPNDDGDPRFPAFFFPAFGGTLGSNLTAGTKYYIKYLQSTYGHFEVYSAPTGGSAIDIAAGAAGVQYFNTFFPQSTDGDDTITFNPARLPLPHSEIGTSLAEVGTNIIVGVESNVIYTWNQLDSQPGDFLPMPENNTRYLLVVNNVAYIFAGNRGNIYITNGSSVSLATTVPDYCSGLIEPYFTWGGAMFLRGRVYFSIQDQTSSHTGQCGGIWSFVPSQNFYIGEDIGLSLRMDNKNSYATFNGLATVLIPSQDQQARGPQYWAAWTSSSTSPTYGIDFSNTVPAVAAVIQTDVVPTGTLLKKKTFSQLEYKLAAPLTASETVALAYRTNLSDGFTSAGTIQTESTTDLAGYVPVSFEKTQWLQLQATLTPDGTSASSFVRLVELRAR